MSWFSSRSRNWYREEAAAKVGIVRARREMRTRRGEERISSVKVD